MDARARTERPVAALAWMALASTFFALMTLTARRSSREVPWALVAGGRGLMAWLVAVGVARARGASLEIKGRALSWGRALLGTASMMTSFYLFAQPTIPLGDLAAIGALTPVIIALAAPRLLGERSGRGVRLAVPLGFLGAVILLQPSFHVSGHLAALALFGTFLSAGAMLFLRRLGEGESPEAVAAHFAWVSAAICLGASLASPQLPAASGLGLLALTGLLGGLGQLSMTHAYSLDHAARVGAAGYLGTVLTIALGAWVLDEPTSGAQLLGSVMVIASGLVLAAGAARA